jgi:hypothetical protein
MTSPRPSGWVASYRSEHSTQLDEMGERRRLLLTLFCVRLRTPRTAYQALPFVRGEDGYGSIDRYRLDGLGTLDGASAQHIDLGAAEIISVLSNRVVRNGTAY